MFENVLIFLQVCKPKIRPTIPQEHFSGYLCFLPINSSYFAREIQLLGKKEGRTDGWFDGVIKISLKTMVKLFTLRLDL